MTVYDRIKALRESHKMSQQELAEKVGFKTASAVNKIELGLRDINRSKLEAFAIALGTTPSYLMGWDDSELPSSPRSTAVRIPVLGRVVAGIPLEAVEDILDWEEIPQSLAESGTYFALQVKGDSMEPRIKEGDVVIVRQQEDVENGETAIVLVNGDEATVKRIKKLPNGIQLLPTNPAYDPLYYSAEEIEALPVRIIGKVVELRGKF